MKRRGDSKTRWFCANGAVHRRDDGVFEVTAGSVLIGTFTRDEPARRDLLLIALADNPEVRIGDLAWAFGISTERLRQIRKFVDEHGPNALFSRKGGRKPLGTRLKKRIRALFDQGLTIDEAYAKVKRSTSRASVGRVHKQWAEERAAQAHKAAHEPRQQELFPDASSSDRGTRVRRKKRPPRDRRAPVEPAIVVGPVPAEPSVEDAIELGGAHVQHLGTWLMLGELHRAGLYDSAERFRCDRLEAEELRTALDGAAVALTIGERSVEGVRRLATPSAPTLLRSHRQPSANWTRERLHDFAEEGSVLLHLDQARRLALSLCAGDAARLTLYIDNHLRTYTGKHVIRKGWRMQDKRVVPGSTDYYVHDAAGRPLMRVDSFAHESLVETVPRIGQFLRRQIGDDAAMLLVFDRAGAYPEHIALLRDSGFQLVTYEKKPYPTLPTTAFDNTLVYRKEVLRWTEGRQKNLRHGRGRVRRIALLTPDGAQVNVLAISDAPAPELALALLGRWGLQENQFKHEKERWGINQLDGRGVEPYPEHAVIPNPARRRLDRELRDARDDEADALRALAHLPADDRRRDRLRQAADDAYKRQCTMEAERRGVPKRAPLRDTELSRRLRYHPGRYKTVIDTLRIALANVETDLAKLLAPHLNKPREAKKTLANLLTAPGTIRATARNINISLEPAATGRERRAFEALLAVVNRRKLTLPGDPSGRPLRFRTAKS